MLSNLNMLSVIRERFSANNIRNFIILDRQYRENANEHFGIILSEQIALRQLLQRTLRFLGRRNADDVKNNDFLVAPDPVDD